jgi:hypothetical protein
MLRKAGRHDDPGLGIQRVQCTHLTCVCLTFNYVLVFFFDETSALFLMLKIIVLK